MTIGAEHLDRPRRERAALLTEAFHEAMTDAGLTRAQQERVVVALAKEPAIVGLVHRQSMDRADFAAGHRA